jgi:para-nitrobenzyl esterase
MPSQVETSSGVLQGTEQAGIRIFRGVRYARAPIGARRFMPPEACEATPGVVDATQVGPAAPQYALPFFGWISGAGVAPGGDCLSLNIWTPGLDDTRRPVLVWIHGGGFLVGAGSTPIYDGKDLARRGDMVVVTINYRLGALGYLHLGGLLGGDFAHSSNLGVRDQIAALEWVRDNIDRFGGDRRNVTVFGQSAGAMSIGALLGAPRARPLFQRAICQSGAADHVLDEDQAANVARVFLEELGGPPASPAALGERPAAEILKAQRATMRRLSDFRTMMVFLPCVDRDVIPEQPLEVVRRGGHPELPLLLGVTLDEWKLFRLVDPGPRGLREEALIERFEEVLPDHFAAAPDASTAVLAFRRALEARGAGTSAAEVWSAFQTARAMHFPAARLAEAQAEAGGSVHSYLFTWQPPALRRVLGACHALDIPFIFGSVRHPLARPFTGLTASASRLSRKMQAAWIQFARDGRPGHAGLPAWQPYDATHRLTMILGRTCSLEQDPLEAERTLFARWSGDLR